MAHISGRAHCLIGWCLLAFVTRWLRASLSPLPVEHKALESTPLGVIVWMRAVEKKKGGSFWWKHLSGIHQVSSAFWSLTSLRYSSKWSQVLCFPLKTLESCSKTKAAEGSSVWTKLSDSGPSKRKICTHHSDPIAPMNHLCCLMQTNTLWRLISVVLPVELHNRQNIFFVFRDQVTSIFLETTLGMASVNWERFTQVSEQSSRQKAQAKKGL